MRMVAEYRKHAAACRKLARENTSPEDKDILENIARSWETLAQMREHGLEPEPVASMRKSKGDTSLARIKRVQIMLSPQELKAVDNFRFQHRMPNRAAAVRELVRQALHAR